MITDIVLRVSGTVDFTDQTTQRFQAVWEDSQLKQPFSAQSLEAFKQLWRQRHTNVDALLELLGGTFTITTGAPTTGKTVKDWTMLVDGRITRDNGTHGNFNAVYDVKGGRRVTGASVFTEIRASAAHKAIVDTVLESLAGTNKVRIS